MYTKQKILRYFFFLSFSFCPSQINHFCRQFAVNYLRFFFVLRTWSRARKDSSHTMLLRQTSGSGRLIISISEYEIFCFCSAAVIWIFNLRINKVERMPMLAARTNFFLLFCIWPRTRYTRPPLERHINCQKWKFHVKTVCMRRKKNRSKRCMHTNSNAMLSS